MKIIRLILVLCIFSRVEAQHAENIIIITTDGFRWQEFFNGMDSSIANDRAFNQDDSAYLFNKYWAADANSRRKKLLPFTWSTLAQQGSIFGNRAKGNKVNTANPYWFSYPGYSEIFTGMADTAINSNAYPPNPRPNVLGYLNTLPGFSGKVAAFGAWDAFDRILNEEKNKIPVYSAFDKVGGDEPSMKEQLINQMMADSYKPFGDAECLDVFTHYAAIEYLHKHKPRVLYIAYGETDEWAHSGRYKDYLDAAFRVDKWIGDIWNDIQSDPLYKNKTVLFVTTDHGRGDAVKKEWTSHNKDIKGADEIWFAAIGPGIARKGERLQDAQYYQQQFAQTIASFLGKEFKAARPIAKKISME